MLTLPALLVRQYHQSFYLLNLTAADVERLVRFEVLGETGLDDRPRRARRGAASASRVHWEALEAHVHTSDKAYQRPIMRKKVEELATYYEQCRREGDLPAIPGSVLLTTDAPVTFSPHTNPLVGLVQLDEREGALRVLDGQHRLLALAALLASPELGDEGRAAARSLQVPAVLFAGMAPEAVVEMFVTINSKHTRLNPSLLFSLKGRQLFSDPVDAKIHDALKLLHEREGSPLEGQIRLLGVGPGKVSQAGLAQELRDVMRYLRQPERGPSDWVDAFQDKLGDFYLHYFREVARVFEAGWASKKHSLRSSIALRAFLQCSREVVPRVWRTGAPVREALRPMLAPWRERVGVERFETSSAWRMKAAGGGKETTRTLARELAAALAPLEAS